MQHAQLLHYVFTSKHSHILKKELSDQIVKSKQVYSLGLDYE